MLPLQEGYIKTEFCLSLSSITHSLSLIQHTIQTISSNTCTFIHSNPQARLRKAKMAASNALPATRVVVTSHSKTGESIFESDKPAAMFYPFGPQGSGFARIHSRLSVPVNNTTSPPDLVNVLPRCPPQGILLCTTDIPPNFTAPMHRTLSLDYGIVAAGEIVLRVDSGEERTVRTGEIIVQKGVNHQWINRSSEVCRIICVMVAADKVVLDDGTALEETVFKK